MFELRTALSYLVPKKGQLSVSVVGVMAVLVIQAITWLVLVFFSTTDGFETRWTQKIVSILGPARVIPTANYYNSPSHLLDSYSTSAGFINRRLSQKADEPFISYNPVEDPPLPQHIEKLYQEHAHDASPIHTLVERLNRAHVRWRFFESTVAHMSFPSLQCVPDKSLSQYSYVIGFDSLQTDLLSSAIEVTQEELDILLIKLLDPSPELIPSFRHFVQALGTFEVIVTNDIVPPASSIRISRGTKVQASITYDDEPRLHLTLPSHESVSLPIARNLPPITLSHTITKKSLFFLRNSGVKEAYVPLTYVKEVGYPLLLPKAARQQGLRLFDTGHFQLPCSSSQDESGIPFYVAGFFDPGILPAGGKLAITARQAVIALSPELTKETPFAPSGIVVDDDLRDLAKTRKTLKHILGKTLSPFFSVQQYNEGEFTADLYQQLSSEKLLFRMLSLIIIAVACSNIFSMLFILAHDRRKEIAVMRALGASKTNVTMIFLMTGLGVGLVGSLLGTLFAALTLHYLPEILMLIGKIQGHELLNQSIFGEIASQTMSLPTFLFTLISISLASSLAGGLAAMRACRINVSASLKGGG